MEPTGKKQEQEELKSLIKGKTPEEIAEIVENYYQAKYEKEKLFSNRSIIGFTVVLFILVIAVLILFMLYRVLALQRHIRQPETSVYIPAKQDYKNVV